MKIEMYTKTICPYCIKAKNLLKSKGVDTIVEYNLNNDPSFLTQMLERSFGAKTVPQIFINNNHIGGCDDLYELESKGELDSLLK